MMDWADALLSELWVLTIALLPLPDRTRIRQTCSHLRSIVDRVSSTDSMVPVDDTASLRPSEKGPDLPRRDLDGELAAGIEGKRSRSRSLRELWRLESPWQHFLVASGHHNALGWHLQGRSADVDEAVPSGCLSAGAQWEGRTALMVAALADDMEMVDMLLEVMRSRRSPRCNP